MTVKDFVGQYLDLGLTPIPVKPHSKKPVCADWPNTDRDRAADLFADNPGCNIGIVLGDTSGGIVDVDLDDPAAVKIGPLILPKTGFWFGRASKPNSHLICRVADAGRLERFRHPTTKEMLVELRGNGHHTVFPGSTHPSGEAIEFKGEPGTPHQTDWEQLRRQCALVAIATVLSKVWNAGIRHTLSLNVAGLLATSGVSRDDTRRLIEAITIVTNDEEAEDRLTSVETTYDRYERGEGVQGRSGLEAELGAETVQSFDQWLRQGDVRQGQGNVRQDNDSRELALPNADVAPSLDEMGTDLGAAKVFADAAGSVRARATALG
jgi:hypothetical protein